MISQCGSPFCNFVSIAVSYLYTPPRNSRNISSSSLESEGLRSGRDTVIAEQKLFETAGHVATYEVG